MPATYGKRHTFPIPIAQPALISMNPSLLPNFSLDEANAMAELNQTQLEADVDSLAAKYDAEPANTAVDDELAALKAQMGL